MDIGFGKSNLIDIFSEPYAISFSFYSKKEIHSLSVVEVICPLFFDKKGYRVHGGLGDSKMGVNSKKDICRTCGGNYLICPGHLGHIDLSVPIKNPNLKNLFFKILKVGCQYCNSFPIQNWRLKLFYFKFVYLEMIFFFVKKTKKNYFVKKINLFGKSEKFRKNCKSKICLLKTINIKIKKIFKSQNFPKICENEKKKRGKFWYFSINFFLKFCLKQNFCKKCGGEKILISSVEENLKVTRINMILLEKNIQLFEEKDFHKDLSFPNVLEEQNSKIVNAKNFEKIFISFQFKKKIEIMWKIEQDFCEILWGSFGNSERFFKQNGSSVFFISSLLVPPTRFRPVYSRRLGKKTFESRTNPQNFYLVKTLKLNQHILLYMGSQKRENNEFWLRIFFQLEKTVSSLIDKSNYPSSDKLKIPSGLKQQLEKKSGIFRMYLMGKRVFHSARSIIAPDPFLESFQVGVPPKFVSNLTTFIPLNFLNFQKLNLLPEQHKKRSVLETLSGKKTEFEISRRFFQTSFFLNICRKYNEKFFKLGKKFYGINRIQTNLLGKNFVLLNRQPSLHRASVMAHTSKIITENKCIKIHYANCNSYNADFDGDEMNLHFPQNELARSEALVLSSAFHHSKVPTHNTLMRGLIQDNIVSLLFLTQKDTFFSENFFFQMICFLAKGKIDQKKINFPSILKPKILWTGKQLISFFLKIFLKKKWHISLESRTKLPKIFFGQNETKVLIRRGEFLRGNLDSSQIGKNKNGIFHAINEIYGNYISDKFLVFFGKISVFFQRFRGFTSGIKDLILKKKVDENRCRIFHKKTYLVKIYLKKNLARNGLFFKVCVDRKLFFDDLLKIFAFQFIHKIVFENFTQNSKNLFGAISSNVVEPMIIGGLEISPEKNCFSLMTNSGAKGTTLNMYQICSSLGQTELEGEFINLGPGGKTLPTFPPFDLSLKANGFIFQRFLTGIPQPEYFFHCMAGREGLLDTSVKTSQSGYVQRSLVKHLESLKIFYDETIRFSENSIFQFFYPKNGTSSSNSEYKYFLPWFFQNQQGKAKPKNSNFRKNRHKKIFNRGKNFHFFKGFFFEKNRVFSDKNLLENGKNFLINLQFFKKNIIHSKELFFEEEKIFKLHKSEYSDPGEPVGIITSQSIGEPCTQMTLNTFHFAGKLISKNNFGIPRLREILLTASKYPKNPTMSISFKGNVPLKMFYSIEKRFQKIFLPDLLENITFSSESSKKEYVHNFRFRLLNKNLFKHQLGINKKLILNEIIGFFKKNKSISLEKAQKNKTLKKSKNIFPIKFYSLFEKWKKKEQKIKKQIKLSEFSEKKTVSIGIRILKKFEMGNFIEKTMGFDYCFREISMIKKGFIDYKEKILHTEGVNFFFFWKNGDIVDISSILTNDIYAILITYGIEASRETLVRELTSIFKIQTISINNQHFDIISDYMTRLGFFRSFSRRGLIEESIVQKITYETALEFIVNASINKEEDKIRSTSSCVGLARICSLGTGMFDLFPIK